jgi:hypothetical protein
MVPQREGPRVSITSWADNTTKTDLLTTIFGLEECTSDGLSSAHTCIAEESSIAQSNRPHDAKFSHDFSTTKRRAEQCDR